ncbi:MAG: hypothetical protein ACI97A_004119, partial [Planctomycetota bacterium]
SEVQSPPDLRSFLLQLGQNSGSGANTNEVPKRLALSNLITITLPIVVLVSIGFAMVLGSLEADLEARVTETNNMTFAEKFESLAAEMEDLKAKVESEKKLNRELSEAQKESSVNLASAGKDNTGPGLIGRSIPMKVQDYSRQQIIDWMLSARGGLTESVNFLFHEATRQEIREAIPKAVLYGSVSLADGGPNTSGARDFLNNYTDQEIEDGVREFASAFNETTPERLLGKFKKAKNMIRKN